MSSIMEQQEFANTAADRDSRVQQLWDVHVVRAAVDNLLNQLGAQPMRTELQAHVALLGQIAAGLAVVDAECLPAWGAGYGSTVTVENLETGECDEYMLMIGSLVDLDAGQVSLASPIGQALLGKSAGDAVTIITPQRQARLLITRVVTLMDWLATEESWSLPSHV